MQDLLNLTEKYNVRAPRYTSYPTAAEFREDVGFSELAAAIERSNGDALPAPLALYLHLPFCQSLCYYCACNRVITHNGERTRRYLRGIPREAELLAPLLPGDRAVEQIHLGGGTPTYFQPDQLRTLLDELRTILPFAAPDRSDWSIEIDPRTVTPDDVRELRAIGFNRLSFGVQDLDPDVQEAINRRLGVEALAELVTAARGAGFGSLNFDLIYGLPYQDTERFGRTLVEVIKLDPDRIALYGYAHLPQRFKAQRLLESEALPRGAARMELLVQAIERLTAAGYEYIGMDHFARPDDALAQARRKGTLVRNFQGYVPGPDVDLLGLGASAISSLGETYVQNTRSILGWEKALETGCHPAERGYVLNLDDRIRRDIISAVMCRDTVEFVPFENRYDIEFREYFHNALQQLKPLEEDGLLDLGTEKLEITPRGRLVLRAIARVFDAHLAPATSLGILPKTAPRYSQIV